MGGRSSAGNRNTGSTRETIEEKANRLGVNRMVAASPSFADERFETIYTAHSGIYSDHIDPALAVSIVTAMRRVDKGEEGSIFFRDKPYPAMATDLTNALESLGYTYSKYNRTTKTRVADARRAGNARNTSYTSQTWYLKKKKEK